MAFTVPFIKPRFPEPETLVEYLNRIYQNNYYSNNGPVYFEFKHAIEDYLGQDIKAVVVANATLGLMMAFKAAIKNVSPKKSYIAVPSFTFAAGPLAIRWCGFEPIFFDIDPDTVQPSIESFEKLLSAHGDKLAGVLLTNNFGIGNEQITAWEKLLARANLPLVIDTAPGFGSTYADGQPTGGRGACEVFSFHATKPFGIGEGGLITTKDQAMADELESLKNFGFNDQKETVVMGMNAKITELDCAIGLCLIKDYQATLADRRASYDLFKSGLEGEGATFLPRAETSAIQFVTILVDPKKRNKIIEALKAGGVEARTYYAPCVHTFPLFAECPKIDLKHTDLVSEKIISLPLHPQMDPSTIAYICGIITKELGKSPRGKK
jgi:dTDP-4-amino-4,6-dideoxygalactose transaminase